MHGPSSLVALVACLSLAVAAPANNDRRAVVTVTKTFYKGMRPTPKPVVKVVQPAEAQIFKEVSKAAPAPAAVSPPEQKTSATASPTTTTTSKQQAAPEPTKPATGGNAKGPSDPNSLTIQVTNKMNVAIMTAGTSNAEVANLMKANFAKPNELAAGASDEVVVPLDWAGRIAVAKKGTSILGRESLIEASFHKSGATIDVSFVDGWTVPIVCSCDGKVQSGCTDDLMSMGGSCPMPFSGGCQNPHRGTTTQKDSDSGAHPFFASCKGAAYTWDTDDNASIFGTCKGTISCCVGTEAQGCPAYNKEIKKKTA